MDHTVDMLNSVIERAWSSYIWYNGELQAAIFAAKEVGVCFADFLSVCFSIDCTSNRLAILKETIKDMSCDETRSPSQEDELELASSFITGPLFCIDS